jgi:hypothetical protein
MEEEYRSIRYQIGRKDDGCLISTPLLTPFSPPMGFLVLCLFGGRACVQSKGKGWILRERKEKDEMKGFCAARSCLSFFPAMTVEFSLALSSICII